MKICFFRLMITACAGIAFSSVLLAQTAPGTGAAQSVPDLSGVWNRPGGGNLARLAPGGPEALSSTGSDGTDGGTGAFILTERPSMTPWAKERYDAVRKGVTDFDEQPPDLLDHDYFCFPRGPSRMFTGGAWPFEIRQMPDVVFLFFERDHWVRRVYMDGRGHPDGYPITWMGHSTGKYDGDALVVDTVGINETSWIDGLGHPHSEALHLIERFRRLTQNSLEYSFTVDDPKAYTKPWGGKKVFERMPRGFDIMEQVICEEHLEMGKKPGTQ
jgi:hypothetical protein